jgi:hypothetical protein
MKDDSEDSARGVDGIAAVLNDVAFVASMPYDLAITQQDLVSFREHLLAHTRDSSVWKLLDIGIGIAWCFLTQPRGCD